jgi:hypothetical protein
MARKRGGGKWLKGEQRGDGWKEWKERKEVRLEREGMVGKGGESDVGKEGGW